MRGGHGLRVSAGRTGSTPISTTSSQRPRARRPIWQMASLMLQSLLEQRFNLKLRTESRITSRYDLTVVRSDPRLKRTPEGECIAQDFDNPQPMAPPDPRVDRKSTRLNSSHR